MSKSEKLSFLDYIARKDIADTEDSMLSEQYKSERKTERILLKLTPTEKRLIERYANKRGKTVTETIINACLLLVSLNKFGANTAIEALKAVRFLKVLKKHGGTSSLTNIVSEKDISFDGDDSLNEYLWV